MFACAIKTGDIDTEVIKNNRRLYLRYGQIENMPNGRTALASLGQTCQNPI